MTVKINIGAGFVSQNAVALLAAENSATLVAPSVSTRIDLVQIDNTSVISVKAGAEGGGAPSADADNMGIATITIPTTATVIKDADDATNGYITDTRAFA